MKKTALFTAALCLLQSSLYADVPLLINYQGKVADSTGLPIGATGTVSAPTAAPVNRKVIFRIYDASTGGNRLWTEEQTATISLGVFSVLLGNGINPTGTAAGESHAALDTIFTPSAATSRFLEIMVDNGDNAINASDVPVSPRQQITSTAFALHAKVADGIASSTDLTINPVTGTATNYGLGWYGTGRTFNSVAIDGPVLYGNSGGALGSNASGTQKLALAWNASGQVGVGATSSYDTNNKLTLQGDDSVTPARQLVIRGNTDTTERLNIGFDTTVNQATLQTYTAASTAGNLLLNPSGGNVGIGSATAPAAKLSIGVPIFGNASTLSSSFVTGAGALGQVAGSELLLGNFGFSNGNSSSLAISGYRTAAGTAWTDTAVVLGMNVDTTPRAGAYLSLHSNGNVGIGTLTPSSAYKLDVNGTARVAGSLTAGGLSVGGAQVATASSSTAAADIGGGDVHTYFGSYTGTNNYAAWLQALRASDQLTFPMAINPNGGNVGIGTANPLYKLDVNGTVHLTSHLYMDEGRVIVGTNSAGGDENTFWPRSSNGTYLNFGSNGLYIRNNSSTNVITAAANGIVSIGNTSTYGLLNVGLSPNVTNFTAYGKLTTGGATGSNVARSVQLSIHTAGSILAPEFDVDSDIRIKTALHPTDSVKDLETLMGLQITNYRLKDTVANSNAPQKKVIAQQVESVYPQAVSIHKGVVPDIFKNATVKDGWIELATDLKVGERVKLVGEKDQSAHEVLEVREGAFRTDSKEESVFVYGREVNDFHSVDYDAIAMLNVSATQQIKREKDAEIQALDRQLKEKDAKIAALEAKVAAQDKRATAQADEDASQNARLVALEKLLNKSGAPETVSTQLGGQ